MHRDHPRVCGEHRSDAIAAAKAEGSSPRMRGAPAAVGPADLPAGIIPAYAGSTAYMNREALIAGDHPRVCGEHGDAMSTVSSKSGSSPRMRGALPVLLAGARVRGIIPAYAGSTNQSLNPRGEDRDHPRVCGERRLSSIIMR